jgi:hypothetical protein
VGFLSNLKNSVTGGAADVQVQCPAVQRGTPVTVQIHAQAKGNANVAGVYLLVRAMERATVSDREWEDGRSYTETINATHTSFEHRLPVAGPFQMVEGQQGQWQAQLHLPQNVGPSMQGHMISHEWSIQAGLDMAGNDPDSGWITIQVY